MGINKQLNKLVSIVFLLLLLLAIAQVPAVAAGTIQEKFFTSSTTPPPPAYNQISCDNGLKDGNETGVDCGGNCFNPDILELCDGEDNDKDCLVDENTACSDNDEKDYQPTSEETQQKVITPTAAPRSTLPEPVSVPVSNLPPSEKTNEQQNPIQPTEVPAETPQEIGAAEGSKPLRELAESARIYLPKEETDTELYNKFQQFMQKHEAEFKEKFETNDLSEEQSKDVLRQFSEETYPKKEEKVSVFVKVARFFKNIFS